MLAAIASVGGGERGFKVAFIGGTAVGKTSIINRFHRAHFSEKLSATIASACVEHPMLSSSSIAVKLKIWDTAGQEKYRSIVPIYYRGAAAIVIVYDLSDIRSFREGQDLARQVKEAKPLALLYMVGNKNDRPRALTLDDANAAALELGIEFRETSARTGDGINDLFQAIADRLADAQACGPEAVPLAQRPKDDGSGCC
jgi:Ras-related protein Rab-5C